MPTIEVDGATIAYTDTGEPGGRPGAGTVVFGHGLLFSGRMFDRQIASRRDRYRCVTVDWRGQGASPAAADGYDMDTLTGDAVALIEHLGVAPVHWVGLSMGGFVGLRLAARHGSLLSSLTLLDTSAGPEDASKAGGYRRMAWVQRLIGVRPLIGRVAPLMFGPAFLADPGSRPQVDDFVRRLGRCDRVATRKAVLGVADRAPVTGELPAITVPTLVVVGADDIATPPVESERIAAGITGARLEVVPDCGHSSTVERPEAVTALLAGFLDTLPAT